MKKAPLALLLLLPLAGCAHQGGAGGGGGGYSYGDCLYPDDCYEGIYRPGYFYNYGTQAPSAVQRARITKVQRSTSTRVVTRQPVNRPQSPGSALSRSAPQASCPRSAPASSGHGGGRR